MVNVAAKQLLIYIMSNYKVAGTLIRHAQLELSAARRVDHIITALEKYEAISQAVC